MSSFSSSSSPRDPISCNSPYSAILPRHLDKMRCPLPSQTPFAAKGPLSGWPQFGLIRCQRSPLAKVAPVPASVPENGSHGSDSDFSSWKNGFDGSGFRVPVPVSGSCAILLYGEPKGGIDYTYMCIYI